MYEKCVCFLFLVIVAFLSCSGFRIDSLAMTDISKRNFHTSSSLSNSQDFFDRLLAETPYNNHMDNRYLTKRFSERRHRIRHSRLFRNQAPLSERRPMGRIDTYVIRPPLDRLAIPTAHLPQSEQFAQIPPSHTPLRPTAAIVTRSQRSSDQNNRQKKKQFTCQPQDTARKAYMANTVVLARAESKSSTRNHVYSVSFRILERLKNSSMPVEDHIRLTFSTDSKSMNCAKEELERSHGLVKAKIQPSKEYVLFLNAYEAHNYSVVGMPYKRRNMKKTLHDIKRVIDPKFEVQPINVNLTSTMEDTDRRLRLVCRTKGFPPPYISWRKDGKILTPNNRMRITYKKKKSTLVVKRLQQSDSGWYECVAEGVNNKTEKKGKEIEIPPSTTPTNSEKANYGQPCNESLRDVYCFNGGTCFYERLVDEAFCVCADGYTGNQCEQKDVQKQTTDESEENPSTPKTKTT